MFNEWQLSQGTSEMTGHFRCQQCPIVLAAGMLFALSTTASIAQQFLPQANVAWPGLTQDDIDRMHAAAARLYEGRSIGTVERWLSPDSKDAGEIKLVRAFDLKGMPCRELDYTIRFDTTRNGPTHYVVNWCKTVSGEWKIVEIPRSR